MSRYITVVYKEPFNEGSGASLATEKQFHSVKSASQFLRRNGIKNASFYIGGQLSLRIGNTYHSVTSLQKMCFHALQLSESNALSTL